jgi:hypothetical protein
LIESPKIRDNTPNHSCVDHIHFKSTADISHIKESIAAYGTEIAVRLTESIC